MTARRKLGESDPGRYRISVLIGPCTLAEAELALDELGAGDVDDLEGLGAVFSLTTWNEEGESE